LVFSFYQKEDKIMKKLLYSILIVALALVVVLPTAVLACHDAKITASITASPNWTKTYNWTIDKSVTPDTWTFTPAVTSGTSTYTITVTKVLVEEKAWFEGAVSVTNDASYPDDTEGLKITVKLKEKNPPSPDTQIATLAVDVSSNPDLAPGETGSYPYHIDVPAGQIVAGGTYEIKAEVTITNFEDHVGDYGVSPKVDKCLPSSPTITNGSIDVDDTNGGTWAFSASGAVSYDKTFTCANEGTNKNTATIRQTNLSDDATVTVVCQNPGISIVKTTNGGDGLNIPVGNPVTWTYTVTNNGNVPLSNITVTDSKGVTPAYVSGDSNSDGKLDTNETWIYTATGTAVAGQYNNTGEAKGKPPTGSNVTATDDSSYFGQTPSNPSITIVKKTNGVHYTGAPGPTIAVGDPVNWTYEVTNPGSNVPLSNITVTDSKGVTPAYVSGDSNSDGKLDTNETWIYSATGIAVAGDYNNTGEAEGKPPTGSNVTATDDSWYYGATPGTPPTTPPEVGGDIYRTDKMALLIPIIALAFALLSGAFIIVKRHQDQK
jgi:uncharacterized repeat protein (TIGR01451 family)